MLTKRNSSIQVGAPTGSAAFNVQGSTIHRLLGINVSRPEESMSETTKEQLKKQLTNLLCLMIDVGINTLVKRLIEAMCTDLCVLNENYSQLDAYIMLNTLHIHIEDCSKYSHVFSLVTLKGGGAL